MHSQRGNSSVGRARPCQGRGREFKSRFPLHKDDSQGHPFFVAGRVGRPGRVGLRGRVSVPPPRAVPQPVFNRHQIDLRPVFGTTPCPQVLQRHPGVTKGASGRSSARPPCPQVPRWHPGVTKGASIRSSARPPCPQASQWHPRVARPSSTGPSPRPSCPQMPQWHPHGATVSWCIG